MFLFRIGQSICMISLVCILSPLAEAADISTLQTALSLAREDMEKAKNKHDADAQAISQQQRVIAAQKKQLADENSRLDKMQKEAKQTWEQYLEAQKKYEKAQASLDAAWGKK